MLDQCMALIEGDIFDLDCISRCFVEVYLVLDLYLEKTNFVVQSS